MKIERTQNKFGLLGELVELKSRIVNNVQNATATIHCLKQAAETDTLKNIPQADLVAMLSDALESLNAVAN